MQDLARMPLEDGGTILFEAAAEFDGPVKVGRIAETIQELPQTLQATLSFRDDAVMSLLPAAHSGQARTRKHDHSGAEAGVRG